MPAAFGGPRLSRPRVHNLAHFAEWGKNMKRPALLLASIPFVFGAAHPAAAAGLTNERLTELCRPQLDAVVPYLIYGWQETIEEARRDGAQNPDRRDIVQEDIQFSQDHIAQLQSKGIQAEEVRELIDRSRQVVAELGAVRTRQTLKQAATDPRSVAEVCIVKAVLADLDGSLQKSTGSPLIGGTGSSNPGPSAVPARVSTVPARSKERPVPHPSDDQKVAIEVLRMDTERQAARAACYANVNAESQRIDALDITFEAEPDGNPILRFHNNTDLQLGYAFEVGIDVDGKSRRGLWVGPPVINPRNDTTWLNTQFSVVQDKGKQWSWQQIWNKRVWPTPINFEACDRNH